MGETRTFKTTTGALAVLRDWAQQNIPKVTAAQQAFDARKAG